MATGRQSQEMLKTWYAFAIVLGTLAILFVVFEKFYFHMVKGTGGF